MIKRQVTKDELNLILRGAEAHYKEKYMWTLSMIHIYKLFNNQALLIVNDMFHRPEPRLYYALGSPEEIVELFASESITTIRQVEEMEINSVKKMLLQGNH